MISEARAPGPDDTGPNRDSSAEIDTFIDNFSFIGMSQTDGSPRVISVRTERDAVFLSGADDGPENVHFNRGTRVVRVDPAKDKAVVTDVVHPPARRRKGLVRSYVVDECTSDEPRVSWTRDDEFEGGTTFEFDAPEGGYIKIYDPSAAGQWDSREAHRLVRSGQMDTRQWHEFSIANQVDVALQMNNVTIPDSPE